MSNVKISMKGITKIFETESIYTYALKNVHLTINSGDYVSISGPSGCGKSTLLAILGLLDTATEGEYFIEGEDVTKLTLDQAAKIRNEKIGFIFQLFNLIDELSIFDNVALPLRYRAEKLPQNEVIRKVNECLDMVELSHRVEHKPSQLSGGQQQRVAIARALVASPVILLVDEPTGNLDSKNGDKIMGILDSLNKSGTTICMVTHDPRYADLATKKFYLSDGVIKNNLKLEAAS